MAAPRASRGHKVLEGRPGTRPASTAPPGAEHDPEPTASWIGALLRHGNFWLSVFFLALSVILISRTFLAGSGHSEQGPIGPWDWPRAVLALLGLCALTDILAEFRSARRSRRVALLTSETPGVRAVRDAPEAAVRPGQDLVGEPVIQSEPDRGAAAAEEPPRPRPAAGAEIGAGAEVDDEAAPEVLARNLRKLLVGTAIVVGYVVAVPTLGFLIATFVFLLLFIYLGGYRRIVWTPVVAVVATLVIVYLFVKVVYIPLPLGAGPFVNIESTLYHALGLY